MTKIKLYVLNTQNQLQCYENEKHNIDGQYTDLVKAVQDILRAASIDNRQFVLIENNTIIRVAHYNRMASTP